MKITIQNYREINDHSLEIMETLEKEIFEKPYPRETLLKSVEGKEHILILVASVDGQNVAYKAGFAHDDQTFYSWVGGVSPLYRKLGIAAKLMEVQHQELKTMGFKKVRTKTKNKFKSMLLLNIKTGFDIVDTYMGADDELRIILEKDL